MTTADACAALAPGCYWDQVLGVGTCKSTSAAPITSAFGAATNSAPVDAAKACAAATTADACAAVGNVTVSTDLLKTAVAGNLSVAVGAGGRAAASALAAVMAGVVALVMVLV